LRLTNTGLDFSTLSNFSVLTWGMRTEFLAPITTMNREIKFRVWDKSDHFTSKNRDSNGKEEIREHCYPKMIYSDYDICLTLDGKLSVPSGDNDDIDGGAYLQELHNQNDYTLQQFTGLTDKNGKDIYFGDIVTVAFHDKTDPTADFRGTATISETINFGVGILYDFAGDVLDEIMAVDEGGQIEDVWEDEELWTIKVIGNIYENPELIKKL